MKIINDEYQKAQSPAGMWGVVPLRTIGGHPGSRRPESAGGPRDALANIVSHCTTRREGRLETQLFSRCSGARLQWPRFPLCSTSLVPEGQACSRSPSRSGPSLHGGCPPSLPGLSDHPDSLLQAQPRQPRKHHCPLLPLTAAQLHRGGMWCQPTGRQPETGCWAWGPGSDESHFHRGSDRRTGGPGVCTVTRA